MTYAGSPYFSMTDVQPSASTLWIALSWSYTSRVRTSVSVALVAAMVSGLPLNVPAMSYSSSMTGRYSSRVAPIAPHGRPPPIAFARQTMSGVTPNASTAPP